MKRIFGIVLAAALVAAISSGQFIRGYSQPGIVPLPSSGTGGQSGGANNPANAATVIANGTDSVTAGSIKCYVYLNHGRAADLTMTLSHCGTWVTLCTTSPNQSASLNGVYSFSDTALTSFSSAVSQAPGLVPAGQYKPVQQLSAFSGANVTGPWVLTITDLASGVSGTAGSMTIEVTVGTPFGGLISPSVAIPDGQNGIPGQPVTRVVNVPTSEKVGLLYATVGLNHTYTSDLTVVLSHLGVSATIMSFNAPVSGANLGGFYTFQDDAGSSWAETVGSLGGSVTVPAGFYRPLSPFSAFRGLDQAGPWYLTVCDSGTGDVGSLVDFQLTIAPSTWDLFISQPNANASATLINTGGTMGNSYANLVTFAPGAFPYGWLYGLDIPMSYVVAQVTAGAPFFGPLNSCGGASTTVVGPIPSGLTAYLTSLEIDPSGSVVNVKPAFSYTTP